MKMYKVNFILANNEPHSHTRLVIEYANELIKFGHSVFISYPIVDFYDFIEFETNYNMSQTKNIIGKLKHLLKGKLRIIYKLFNPNKYTFLGGKMVSVNANVILNKYTFKPSEFNMPNADIIMSNQDYLLKHLVSLPDEKGVLIGSVHSDYKMVDKNRSTNEMYIDRMILLSKRINIPRLSVSETAMISAQNIGINVSRVINNGIRSFPCENIKDDKGPIIIMLFSSTRKEKGLSDGIKVINKLRKLNIKNISFSSIGKIDEKSSKQFDFNYGFVTGDDYFKALCKADIFIYPSLYDGFAGPPMEAVSCGCALVTTLVAGVDEWAIDGENSLVVEPGDLEGMVNSVIKLIKNPNLLTKISNNGIQVSKKYSWSLQTEKLVNFFNFCVDRPIDGKIKN